MLRGIFALMLLALPAPGLAQSFEQSFADLSPEGPSREAGSLEGSWALRLDGAIIFRFDLAESGEGWSGTWSRPRSFASDGNRFANLRGPAEEIESAKSRALGNWIELTFADERPGAVPDIFRFQLLEPDRVEMIYAETGLAPYTLERVAPDALLGPWESGHVYARAGFTAAAGPVSGPPAPEAEGEEQGPPAEPAFEGR